MDEDVDVDEDEDEDVDVEIKHTINNTAQHHALPFHSLAHIPVKMKYIIPIQNIFEKISDIDGNTPFL